MNTFKLSDVTGYMWNETTRSLEFMVGDEQRDRLREQLNGADDFKHKPLIDKAIEEVIARLIRERIEARVALQVAQKDHGHNCVACGMWTEPKPETP